MPDFQRRKKQFLIYVLVWSLALLVFSLLSHDMVWSVLPKESFQSTAHVIAYGFLTYLLCFYLRFRRSMFKLRMTDVKVYVIACLLTITWGAVTELAQSLRLDRYGTWDDCFFDALGAVIGVIVFLSWQFRHHQHWTKRAPLKLKAFQAKAMD